MLSNQWSIYNKDLLNFNLDEIVQLFKSLKLKENVEYATFTFHSAEEAM